MTTSEANRFAPVAALLLVLALAVGAAAAFLLLKGAVGYDSSDLCGPEDEQTACTLDVEANQRHQDLIFTLGLAGGAASVVLAGGALVTGAAGRRRG